MKNNLDEFINLFSSIDDACMLLNNWYDQERDKETIQRLSDRVINKYESLYYYDLSTLSNEINSTLLLSIQADSHKVIYIKNIVRKFFKVARQLNIDEDVKESQSRLGNELIDFFRGWVSRYGGDLPLEGHYLILCRKTFKKFSVELDKACLPFGIDLIEDIQKPLDIFLFRDRGDEHIATLGFDGYGDLFNKIGFDLKYNEDLRCKAISKIQIEKEDKRFIKPLTKEQQVCLFRELKDNKFIDSSTDEGSFMYIFGIDEKPRNLMLIEWKKNKQLLYELCIPLSSLENKSESLRRIKLFFTKNNKPFDLDDFNYKNNPNTDSDIIAKILASL